MDTQELMDFLPSIVFEVDANIKFTYINQAGFQQFGYTRQDLENGYTALDMIADQDRHKAIANIQKSLNGKTTTANEYMALRKDKSTFPVLIHSVPIIKDDKPVGIRGSIVDITRQKKIEKLLKGSRQRFRDLVEVTSDWIWEVNAEGAYTFSSPTVKDILGFKPHEVIGKTPFDFIRPDQVEKIKNQFRQYADKPRSFSGLENINLHKDGHEIVLETGGEPIFDEAGKFCGFRGIDRDISARKKVEAELQKAHAELEKRVEQRTAELQESNRLLKKEIGVRKQTEAILKTKTRNLEEMNSALKILLQRRDEDKRELEEKMLSNVKHLIEPYLTKLGQSRLNDRQATLLKILKSNMDEILSPFASNLSSAYFRLTPKEIQIADLIKHGKTNKEIAEITSSSVKTIEFHRNNIRKKFGLKDSKVNLKTHLLSLN